MPLTPFSTNEIPVVGEPEDDYSEHAQAFAYAMQRFANEANALSDLENASTTCTSTTSNNLTAGAKTFTVPSGLGFVQNMSVRCGNTASPGNYSDALVTSYVGTTLQVTFGTPVGSGSGITTWGIFKLPSAANLASLTSNTFTGTQNFAEGAAVASAATVSLTALTDGNTRALTGTTNINAWTIQNGSVHNLIYTGAGLTLIYSSTTNRLNSGGVNLTLATNDRLVVSASAGVVNVMVYKDSGLSPVAVPVQIVKFRQSIQYGPITATGIADLIPQSQVGNTLAAGVTLKGSTAAFFASVGNGYNSDGSERNLNRIRSTDLTIAALTASSTNYIWYDAVADTAGFVTVADSFQYGGTIPVTNNQYTYDTLNNVMYLGNGTTAVQSNRLIVAEVDTNGTVVTAIRVRPYKNQYDSGYTATLPNTATVNTRNHNLGRVPDFHRLTALCTSADNGFAIGDTISWVTAGGYSGTNLQPGVGANKNTVWLSTGGAGGIVAIPKGGGVHVALTPASWSWKLTAGMNPA